MDRTIALSVVPEKDFLTESKLVQYSGEHWSP